MSFDVVLLTLAFWLRQPERGAHRTATGLSVSSRLDRMKRNVAERRSASHVQNGNPMESDQNGPRPANISRSVIADPIT